MLPLLFFANLSLDAVTDALSCNARDTKKKGNLGKTVDLRSSS